MTEAKPPSATRPMSLSAVLAFACAYMPFAALQLSVAVQLPRFYATHLGLGAAAGAAFGIVRLIDVPVDPALGLVMDRTRTRFGRYRPWIVLGVPILMLAIYRLYEAEPGIDQGYLILWLLVMYAGMSMLLVGSNAWASTLARTYRERSRIFGAMSGLGVIGAATALLIPVIAATSHHTDAKSMQMVGWFLLGLVPLAVGLALLRTPERMTQKAKGARFQLRDYLTLIARPDVIRILAADFFVTLGPGWMSALYLFYFKDSRQLSITQANLLLMLYIGAGLIGAPATAWLANRTSKHRALIVTTTLYSLLLIVIPLLPRHSVLPYVPVMFVLGASAAGFVVAIRAITADVGDAIRLEKGVDQIGLLYAVTSATTKAATALAVTLTFGFLGFVGYNFKEGVVNGPAQIHGLEMAYVIGPIVFVMLGGAAFLGFKLSAERHAQIRSELEARDALPDDALNDEAPVLQTISGEPGEVAIPGS